MQQLFSCYEYDFHARYIAHGIKVGNIRAIKEAAHCLARFVTSSDVLIPMPSHSGIATVTLNLCNMISSATGASVKNILKGIDRESLYNVKKRGDNVRTCNLGLYVEGNIPNGNLIVVDNVIDTGYSAKCAIDVLGDCKVIAYSKTKNYDSTLFD